MPIRFEREAGTGFYKTKEIQIEQLEEDEESESEIENQKRKDLNNTSHRRKAWRRKERGGKRRGS